MKFSAYIGGIAHELEITHGIATLTIENNTTHSTSTYAVKDLDIKELDSDTDEPTEGLLYFISDEIKQGYFNLKYHNGKEVIVIEADMYIFHNPFGSRVEGLHIRDHLGNMIATVIEYNYVSKVITVKMGTSHDSISKGIFKTLTIHNKSETVLPTDELYRLVHFRNSLDNRPIYLLKNGAVSHEPEMLTTELKTRVYVNNLFINLKLSLYETYTDFNLVCVRNNELITNDTYRISKIVGFVGDDVSIVTFNGCDYNASSFATMLYHELYKQRDLVDFDFNQIDTDGFDDIPYGCETDFKVNFIDIIDASDNISKVNSIISKQDGLKIIIYDTHVDFVNKVDGLLYPMSLR